MNKIKSIFAITGASGFIGQAIVRSLRSEGITVLELGRTPSPHCPGHDFYFWELGMPIPSEIGSRASFLIHCAWVIKSTRAHPIDLNERGSKLLVDSAKKLKINGLLFISSLSAYSKARSNYGRAKYRVEEIFQNEGGVVIRPGLVYGESSGGLFASFEKMVDSFPVVPALILLQGKIYLCHIDDLIRVISNTLKMPSPNINLIIAAHPQGITFRELIRNLARQSKKLVFIPSIPWQAIWVTLKFAEFLRINLRTSADSLLSLAYPNPELNFEDSYPLLYRKWN